MFALLLLKGLDWVLRMDIPEVRDVWLRMTWMEVMVFWGERAPASSFC